jgi:hypothetical protein
VALIQTLITCKGSLWGKDFKPLADFTLYLTWGLVLAMQSYVLVTVFVKYRAGAYTRPLLSST